MSDQQQDRIGSFSQGELQLASWWVRHRLELRRFGFGFLITICVLFWGFAIAGLVDAYVISYPRESRITRQIAINQQLLSNLEGDRPRDVSVTEVSVFNSTADRLDFMVEITNPNDQWWAEFNYRFNVSGEETPLRTGYVIPSGMNILTELGYTPKTRGSRNASLIVDNIKWHRIDPTLTNGDYPGFYKNRFQLSAKNLKYDTTINYNGRRVGQSSFDLVNESSYGFWDVSLLIRLYRGSSIAAIQTIHAERLKPGELRSLQVTWPDSLTGVSKSEVIPQVNIVNRASYLDPKFFEPGE